MSCKLLNMNYTTNYAVFSIDSESDINILPKHNVKGKANLWTINSVAQGSLAIGTNGTNYILNGSNEWVTYNKKINRWI